MRLCSLHPLISPLSGTFKDGLITRRYSNHRFAFFRVTSQFCFPAISICLLEDWLSEAYRFDSLEKENIGKLSADWEINPLLFIDDGRGTLTMTTSKQ